MLYPNLNKDQPSMQKGVSSDLPILQPWLVCSCAQTFALTYSDFSINLLWLQHWLTHTLACSYLDCCSEWWGCLPCLHIWLRSCYSLYHLGIQLGGSDTLNPKTKPIISLTGIPIHTTGNSKGKKNNQHNQRMKKHNKETTWALDSHEGTCLKH